MVMQPGSSGRSVAVFFRGGVELTLSRGGGAPAVTMKFEAASPSLFGGQAEWAPSRGKARVRAPGWRVPCGGRSAVGGVGADPDKKELFGLVSRKQDRSRTNGAPRWRRSETGGGGGGALPWGGGMGLKPRSKEILPWSNRGTRFELTEGRHPRRGIHNW